MNTPSHWLMTMAAGKVGPWKGSVPKWSLGLGSLAPDIPLYILSFAGLGLLCGIQGKSFGEAMPILYGDSGWFFNSPIWIVPHQFFHSPTNLLLLLVGTFLIKGLMPKLGRWMMFFLAACLLHSAVDVFTHFDDGPLLLFPFDWNLRFSSTVSYWDPAHYGRPFMVIETVLDLLLAGFLLFCWLKDRKKRPNTDSN